MILDPDYARTFTIARITAWSYGYALTVHGSATRDLDLLAVPWTKEASIEPIALVKCILSGCPWLAILRDNEKPTIKPHGRLTWTLIFTEFHDPRWIDLSVFPPTTNEVER